MCDVPEDHKCSMRTLRWILCLKSLIISVKPKNHTSFTIPWNGDHISLMHPSMMKLGERTQECIFYVSHGISFLYPHLHKKNVDVYEKNLGIFWSKLKKNPIIRCIRLYNNRPLVDERLRFFLIYGKLQWFTLRVCSDIIHDWGSQPNMIKFSMISKVFVSLI